jgi:hypothetical protein
MNFRFGVDSGLRPLWELAVVRRRDGVAEERANFADSWLA